MFYSQLKFSQVSIALAIVFLLLFNNSSYAQDTSETTPQIGITQKIGDVILFTLPTATLATNFIIGDEKGTWQYTKGLLLTVGVTYGLKYSINKQRPDMSNDNSFPSGHTSTVFHSAGYIHRRYGLVYAIPAYALAGFTGASRIDSNKHDILDIIAGAAIGLGSNLLFTSEYQKKHMELTYTTNTRNHMIGFNYKF